MGKKSSPAPDYTAVANASVESAKIMSALGKDQLAFAKQQYEETAPLARQVAESQIAAQSQQMQQAKDYYDYQINTFRPLEQGLVKQAAEFNSDGYREEQAREAAAASGRAFGLSQQANQRSMASMGVNPNSGRYAAQQQQSAMGLAAQRAGAMTGARQHAQQMGWARQMDATGLGRGLSGASLGAYQGATGAGSAGVNSAMAAGNQYMQGMAQGSGTIGQGLNMQMNGLTSVLNGQVSQNNAATNAQGEMWGAVLGTAGTLGAAAISDRRLKEDITKVGYDAETGLNIYTFRYKSQPERVFRGVMADEVRELYPDAVVNMPNGYLAVDYNMLGLEMTDVTGH
ncbi:MAG: tail fiber domain-containing protein [Sulfuricella sp.]